jgi:hypothetical protein
MGPWLVDVAQRSELDPWLEGTAPVSAAPVVLLVRGDDDVVRELLPNALDVSVDHPREAGAQPERGKGRGKLAPAQLFAAYYEHRHQTPPPKELQQLFDAIHEEAGK